MQKKLLISLLCCASLTYAADNFKLGFVDVNKIFTTSKPAVALQEALKVKYTPQQNQLQAMNTNLVNEQTQLQAIMKKAPSPDKLSAADKTKFEQLEANFQKDQLAFQQKYTSFQQAVQKSQDFASAAVLNKANNILRTISENGGYDLVLTSNQLVYAKPKYDLTDQVIDQLNQVNTTELLKQLDAAEKQNATNPSIQGLAPSATKPLK
ncbi:MAG: hypothetical protein RL017_117 [Pseudomonadota bacterium]|jgi:outer membrane protein|nr:OmpH family outer membrane protein [Burkholderiales bacterium]